MKIKHLMHRADSFVRPSQTIAEAINHYLDHESNCVPVVDRFNKPLGILTIYQVVDSLRKGVSIQDRVEKIYVPSIESVNQEVGFDTVRDLPLERLLVLDDTGNLVGVLSKIEMINRIFEAFDLAAEELKTLLMTVPLAIMAIDTNGTVTEINNAAEKILEIEAHSAYGQDIGVLLQGTIERADVLAELEPRTVTIQGVRCIIQARQILKDNQFHGTVIVFQDISELDALSQELDSVRTLLAELDVIVSSIPDPLIVVDESGNTVYVNDPAERQGFVKACFDTKSEYVSRKDIPLSAIVSEILEGTRNTSFSEIFTGNTGREIILKYSPVRNERQQPVRHVFHIRDITEMNTLRRESAELRALCRERANENEFIYRSEGMKKIMAQVRKVAMVESTVLVLGESGVGKGEIAQRIHACSSRSDKPFMVVNCGAIPENLMESELFGYERGAFTGAERGGKVGILELANHGCLFLDEIGEMPLPLQVKLLHFLQDAQIMRVGGSKPIKLDVRIISATNQELYELVQKGLFRKDLFYRLNVVPFTIPPLRERVDDILPLAHHFLNRINTKYDQAKRLCPETSNLLERYDWPGNVRELMNVIERITIMSDEDVLAPTILPAHFNYPGSVTDSCRTGTNCLRTALENVEHSMIKCALNKYKSLRPASRALGISHPTLIRKMRKYGLTVH